MRDQLARLPSDLSVNQDVRADLVIVPLVARRELKIPVHVARVGIIGDDAVGVEVVARPIERIEHRHRIAGSPQGLVGDGIVGACEPHCAAPSAPGTGIAATQTLPFESNARARTLMPAWKVSTLEGSVRRRAHGAVYNFG